MLTVQAPLLWAIYNTELFARRPAVRTFFEELELEEEILPIRTTKRPPTERPRLTRGVRVPCGNHILPWPF